VAFALIELSLRVFYPPPVRFFYPQEFYDFDHEIGHTLRPGQTAFTHDHPVQTNSLGLRDREVGPNPTAGTLRVLALGDSQTFGNGLSLSDTWPKQLERRLQQVHNVRWEVINAGIPGTDTWQHEILLARLLKATNPHVVVLALYVNDVVPRHDPRRGSAAGQTNTWNKRLLYLLKRSALVTWIYHDLLVPWQARRFEHGSSVEEDVLAGRRTDRAERGWRQVEGSLTAMKKLTDARGVTLLVAMLPRRDQVSGNHPGRAFGERAHDIAEAHGITAVDLLPSLSERYRRSGDALFIPWDGHNSAVANEVIAERLAATLEGRLQSLPMHRPTPRKDP
jgi:lysophospholipase L1-like esterase